MFKQAKQNRAFEDVIFQIQEAILQGGLKAGDKLPSERKLKETFGVSRGTLREALRALEQKGLITIKTGVKGGAIVCSIDAKWVSESLDLLLRYQKISLKELSEFREEVEGVVAAKAAQMAKDKDIKELKILLKSIADYFNLGELEWDKIVRLDKAFHLSLARITGNRMYESILFSLYENINRYFERFLPKGITISKNTYKELSKITEAIEARDSNKARTLIQNHVKRYYQMMKKGENQ